MTQEITRVLKRWETSLERYGKLDEWKRTDDLSILGNYLRSKQGNGTIREHIRLIRDKAICQPINATSLVTTIRKAISMMEPDIERPIQVTNKNGECWIQKNGQDVRFRHETQHIFMEKLRFKDGMFLRNFDIETEATCDSRKVRRIVEKRMCQAYHRMHKRVNKGSNHDRYWKHRATAFQLYNIGQIENVHNLSRGESSHWKIMYDPQTGGMVFKKKMAYDTEQDALEAISVWKILHPSDTIEMHAYKCEKCHKWHKGHNASPIRRRQICHAEIAC